MASQTAINSIDGLLVERNPKDVLMTGEVSLQRVRPDNSGKVMIGSSPRSVLRNSTSPVRPATGEAMRGRDAEWRIIGELLRRAQRGLGGLLLIDGEWGVGKSLLLRESEREAAVQGFSLAAGSADRIGREIPFFALLAALNEPFGSRTAEDHHDLADTVAWRLGQIRARLEQRAGATPVLVTLDDLQWASPATLLALRVLPRELARYPVAWILARASTQQDNLVDLLFRVLESDGAIHLWLAPLTDDAVTSVLTEAFGAPPDRSLLALASGAAGNPALLTELIRGLRDDDAVQVTDGYARSMSDQLPQRIHTVARRRLDGLSQRTRHLLKIAALLGRSFRLEDVAEMLGEPPGALLATVEEAMDAGIVTAAEDTLSFRQELLRHPAAETIPLPVRRTLHRQLGDILLNRGCAVMAAEHLLEATHSSDPAALNGLDSVSANRGRPGAARSGAHTSGGSRHAVPLGGRRRGSYCRRPAGTGCPRRA